MKFLLKTHSALAYKRKWNWVTFYWPFIFFLDHRNACDVRRAVAAQTTRARPQMQGDELSSYTVCTDYIYFLRHDPRRFRVTRYASTLGCPRWCTIATISEKPVWTVSQVRVECTNMSFFRGGPVADVLRGAVRSRLPLEYVYILLALASEGCGHSQSQAGIGELYLIWSQKNHCHSQSYQNLKFN
jgi:hypothetical protein